MVCSHLKRRRSRQHGFTLLEVMVALTITGMTLGALFGIIAGSKRLSWRSEDALHESIQARNLINFAQLNDTLGAIFVDFENDDLILVLGDELETPERKTQAMPLALEAFEILDGNGESVASGSHWVELEFAEF